MQQTKRAYRTFSDERMQSAVNCIRNEGVSIKRASEMYAINRTTLMNHVKNYKCNAVGRPTVLTKDEEQLIVHALVKLSDWGFGLDRFQLQICVQDYLRRIDRENPFKNGLPGKDWLAGFQKRWKNQLSRRIAQNLPKNRAEACSDEVMRDFAKKLKATIERNNLENKPQNIFNCDETGFQTDVGIQKILCRKGSRNPHKVVGSVTKSTYTVLVCCSAIGDYLPLYINYKGFHLYSNWCQNGPKDAVYNCSPSGWMESAQFASWFENVFIKHTAHLEGTKLLIFDGHNSHLTIPLIELACANNIELFCLPAHTSHALQPLDVGVFKGVKNAWRNVLKTYYQDSGCKNVDKVVFPSLLRKLEESGCFSRANAIGGFEGSGIFPLNEEKIMTKCETTSTSLASENTDQEEGGSVMASPASTSGLRSQGLTPQSSTSNQATISPKKSLELSILSALKRKDKTTETPKRNRVRRKFAESLTSAEILQRMREENNRKTEKKTKNNNTRKKEVESSSDEGDASLELNDNSDLEVTDMIEEEHNDFVNTEEEPVQVDHKKIGVDSWVIVKFSADNRRGSKEVYYVGKVTEVVSESEVTVTFLRKKQKCFVYPNVADESTVLLKDVVKSLPEPTIRRGMHSFNTVFSFIGSGESPNIM